MSVFFRVLLACAAAIAAPAAASAQGGSEAIFVRVDDLRCLMNNRTRYQGLSQNPVLVVFAQCGSRPAQRDVSDQRLPKLRTAAAQQPTSVLSLRQAELDCLADAGVEQALLARAQTVDGVRVVEWPDNVCSL